MSKNKKEKKKKLKYPNAPVTSEKYKRLENWLVFGGIILVNIVAVIIGILLNKYANLGDTLEIAVKYACSFIVILPLFVFYLHKQTKKLDEEARIEEEENRKAGIIPDAENA